MDVSDPNLKVTRHEVYYGGLQVNNQAGDFIPYSEHKRVVQYLLDRIAQLEHPMYCVQEDGKIERMPISEEERLP